MIEHYIVSTIAVVVPLPIRQKTRELWESAKDTFTSMTGYGEAAESAEKTELAGRWGVEEAQERHAEEASESTFPVQYLTVVFPRSRAQSQQTSLGASLTYVTF